MPDATRGVLVFPSARIRVPSPRSADAGPGTWTTRGPEGGEVEALAIDPSNPDIVYCATNGGGIFKSTDGGARWTAINRGLTDTVVLALAIDRSSPATVYA